jgi:tetrahydromethanopterin S-methyltransferase subunit D
MHTWHQALLLAIFAKGDIINEAIISVKEEGGSLRSFHDPRY